MTSTLSTDKTSEAPRVLIDIEDHVAHVRLNRPDKMNALDNAMFEGIVAAGEQLRQDDVPGYGGSRLIKNKFLHWRFPSIWREKILFSGTANAHSAIALLSVILR